MSYPCPLVSTSYDMVAPATAIARGEISPRRPMEFPRNIQRSSQPVKRRENQTVGYAGMITNWVTTDVDWESAERSASFFAQECPQRRGRRIEERIFPWQCDNHPIVKSAYNSLHG
jgi:hypothetical protein